MKSLVVKALILGAITAAAVPASSIHLLSRRSQEFITVRVGDTLSPQFYIRTDTVLSVIPVYDSATRTTKNNVFAKSCGTGAFFARLYRRSKGWITQPLNGDTVTVVVTGCNIQSLGTAPGCWNKDSIVAARVLAETTVTSALFPPCDTTKAPPINTR